MVQNVNLKTVRVKVSYGSFYMTTFDSYKPLYSQAMPQFKII